MLVAMEVEYSLDDASSCEIETLSSIKQVPQSMGCGISRLHTESVETDLTLDPIAERGHFSEHVYNPRLDGSGREALPAPRLTREQMLSALGSVAEYLSKRGANFTIIVVGGALNVILLESRGGPEDVDFFTERLTFHESRLLEEAAAHVTTLNPGLNGSITGSLGSFLQN